MIASLVAAAALALGAATPVDPAGESELRGVQAYLAYVNAHGGVRGRQLTLALDPTPADVLVSLEQLPSSAAPPPRAEGEAYGRYLAATEPDARVAVLVSGDEQGRLLLAGLRRRAAAQIVAVERVDPALPDVAQQLAALQAAGATALCLLAPAFAAEAYAALTQLRWRPLVVAAASPATPPAGTVSATWLNDEAPLLRRLARGVDVRDRSFLAGLAKAFTAVDVLRRAGPAPTRTSVARAAARLVEANNPFLLPGVQVAPAANVVRLALARWSAGRWHRFGGLVAART